jgi:sulfur carrier protein ThiS adenylyltransferase
MEFNDIKKHLSKFRVGIAGAGGLGSNCAVALARSGVGTLVICDFDVVEASNLNRQYYFAAQVGEVKTEALKKNIELINPGINVIAHKIRLDSMNIPEIFKGCDIIVEAFDNAPAKQMIVETIQTRMKGTPLLVGSGLAGWGDFDKIQLRKIDDTLYVCGDESSDSASGMPVMAPRVGIVANMQANTVVEILMKSYE